MTQMPPQSPHGAPPAQKSSKTGWIIAAVVGGVLIVVLVCGGVLTAILLPALGKARQSARQAVSQSNMRQIGLMLNNYAQDWKEWYPDNAANWELSLSGDMANGKPLPMFTDPGTPPGVASYFYVPGYRRSTIGSPATTVLVYQNPVIDTRGGGVLYADGHVEFIENPRFRTLVDSLKTPDGKPYAPPKSGAP